MQQLARDLWMLRYPLSILGAQFGRTTTVIRLPESDRLLIHSSAPFTDADVAAIQQLGNPSWLVDATGFHDTYVKTALASFPGAAYHAPVPGQSATGTPALPLIPPPAEWLESVAVLPLQGLKQGHEHVFLHRPSRTLILADLLFNLPTGAPLWTRIILRTLSGLSTEPGMSRLFQMIIGDRAAFTDSLRQMMSWDFDRVIVGHGAVIESSGKAILKKALQLKDIQI